MRVLADRRGRRGLVRTAAVDRHQRVDVARREDDGRRARVALGRERGRVTVRGPGSCLATRRAELRADHENDRRGVGQSRHRLAAQQIARDRSDADPVEARAHGGVREPRHGDHRAARPCRGGCAVRHASERRAHLSGRPENHDVAVDRRQRLDDFRRGS